MKSLWLEQGNFDISPNMSLITLRVANKMFLLLSKYQIRKVYHNYMAQAISISFFLLKQFDIHRKCERCEIMYIFPMDFTSYYSNKM